MNPFILTLCSPAAHLLHEEINILDEITPITVAAPSEA
jgi:hypothetical protein